MNMLSLHFVRHHHPDAMFLKAITILVLAGWILTWFFASEESRNRLTDEVRQSIGFELE